MAKRSAYSLIFLGAQRTDRVDLGPGPEYSILAQQHQLAQGVDDAVLRFEAVLAAGPKIGKLVWVLWEEAIAQLLDMPDGVIEGLDRHQLADALSFEAEPLTGIAASDSAIDGVPLRNAANVVPGYRRFWVTQLSAATLKRFEDVLRSSDAKLAGIIHPGGLPRANWDIPEASASVGDWRRIEIWDQLTFILHGRPDGSVETRVIRSTPGSEEWAAELPTQGPVSWMGPGPVTRVGPDGRRVPDALTPFSDEGYPIQPVKIDWPADAASTGWLTAWAAELTSKTRRVPVVESISHVSPHRKYFLVGGLTTTLALAICLIHAGLAENKLGKFRGLIASQEAIHNQQIRPDTSKDEENRLNAEAAGFEPDLRSLVDKEQELTIERNRRQQLLQDVTAANANLSKLQQTHRPALAALLATLADFEHGQNPDQIIVKEIRQEGGGELRLTGLCRQSALADEFASRLADRVGGSGFKVGAAEKSLRDDGEAFDFSVLITPIVMLDSPALHQQNNPDSPTTIPAGSQALSDTRAGVDPQPLPGGHRQ